MTGVLFNHVADVTLESPLLSWKCKKNEAITDIPSDCSRIALRVKVHSKQKNKYPE